MQELWQNLLKTALPGTAQAVLGKLVLPELEALITGPHTPESRLLRQAAALSLYQRAGHQFQSRFAERAAVAEPESRVLCPDALLAFWQKLLSYWPQARFKPDWRLLQRETLRQLANRGWRFPHHLLPELLEMGNDWGREDPQLRLEILPLLGRRGIWLAAGPATAQAVKQPWKWVFDPQLPQDSPPLEQGALAASLYLRRLRQQDPQAGLRQLQALWPKASPTLRSALLPVLQAGLNADDEAFLETCLDDKRLRQAAQELLSHLPQSCFVARMQARILPLLSLKPLKKRAGAELDLRLPAWPTDPLEAAVWARDGLEKASFSSLASRQLVAEALLKCCPPASWLKHLLPHADQAAARVELLELVQAATYFKHLLSGLVGATLNFADAEMAQALLARPALWQRNPHGQLLPLALVPVLSLQSQQEAYLKALAGNAAGVPPQAWVSRRDGQAVGQGFVAAWAERLATELQASASLQELHLLGISPSLLLPPFLILGAAPEWLPVLETSAQHLLAPLLEAEPESKALPDKSLQQAAQDLSELLRLLELRAELYRLFAFTDNPN